MLHSNQKDNFFSLHANRPKMRYIALIAFRMLVLAGISNLYAQAPKVKCPRNFDSKKYALVQKDAAKHQGETVAFDVQVESIEKGYNEKPYFKACFESGDTIWIASMITGNYVTVGRKLRLLGYLDPVAADDEIGNRYNKGGIQVRVFAILDLESKSIQISDSFDKEVKEWMDGIMPKNVQ
jgi:hypothetical protein